jgi:hypothetical protein
LRTAFTKVRIVLLMGSNLLCLSCADAVVITGLPERVIANHVSLSYINERRKGMFRELSVLLSAAILTLFIAASSAPALQDSIIAAWAFEEGSGKAVRDAMGNLDDGEIQGSGQWSPGKFGQALEFDGNTYIQVPFGPTAQVLNEGDFTLAAWLYTDLLGTERGNYLAAFQQMDGNGDGRTWLGIKGDDRTYSYLGNGDTFGPIPPVSEWYHVAVVVQENGATDTIQIYFNGKIDGNAPSNRGIETCEGDFLIGAHKALSAANFWEGMIDDIVIANEALSEAEISELMSVGVMGVLSVESSGKVATTWGRIKLN